MLKDSVSKKNHARIIAETPSKAVALKLTQCPKINAPIKMSSHKQKYAVE